MVRLNNKGGFAAPPQTDYNKVLKHNIFLLK